MTAVIETSPSSQLEFILSKDKNDEPAAVTLTLRHVGENVPMAFKVKTTQPRRYLVRPNQGLISPGKSEKVNIVMIDKDKQTLYESFARLGQSALDNCKDKFLVQSCHVTADFEHEYLTACEKDSTEAYDKLSSMWASMSTSNPTAVLNKKLHVRHIAFPTSTTPTSSSVPAPKQPSKSVEKMDRDELLLEIKEANRKYDELIAFSVNLTAERDVLSNNLEQTKRELTRELNKTAAQRNASSSSGRSGMDANIAGGSSSMVLLLIAFIMFLVGVRLEAAGYTGALKSLPVLKVLLGGGGEPVNAADEL